MILALCDRVAGRRRLYPGVPFSGVATPDTELYMAFSILPVVAHIDALLVLVCGRLLGDMSSHILS